MQIKRIYYDVIREGFYSGRPSVFLEFREKEGKSMSVEDAVKRVNSFPCKTLSVTGNAFHFEKELRGIIGVFRDSHFLRVLIDGEYYVPDDVCDQVACWSVNIRCPSSGLVDENKYSITRLGRPDEVRFYINEGDDLEFASLIAHKHNLQVKTNVMLIPSEPLLSRTADFITEHLTTSYISVSLKLKKSVELEEISVVGPEDHSPEQTFSKIEKVTSTEEKGHTLGAFLHEEEVVAPVVKRKRGRP